MDLKNFSNYVKENFHGLEVSSRTKWLDFKPSSSRFHRVFTHYLNKIRFYQEESEQRGDDYSLSLSFIFRCTTLCQNRGLGYLPACIAEVGRKTFRERVNRPVERLDIPKQKMILAGLAEYFKDSELPPGILNTRDRSLRTMHDEIYSSIEIPMKQTASTQTFVKNGGKLEDIRSLFNTARDNKWRVPIRDLENNNILSMINCEEIDHETDLERFLFWISYAIAQNYWYKEDKDNFVFTELFDRGKPFEYDKFLDARIIHVSEPQKERNLTTCSLVYNTLLTPAGKLGQYALAQCREHRTGLISSSHDWSHLKRLSIESKEDVSFVYDLDSGKIQDNVVHVFKDWTESTDFISKQVGYLHLRWFLEYIGFPSAYKKIVLATVVAPQPVTEVFYSLQEEIEGEKVFEPIKWKGSINEGFMMGNPVTKLILHSLHCSELGIAMIYLKNKGIKIKRPPLSTLIQANRLDRKAISGTVPSHIVFGFPQNT